MDGIIRKEKNPLFDITDADTLEIRTALTDFVHVKEEQERREYTTQQESHE